MRGYLNIHPVAARASTGLSVRRESVGSSFAASSVQETGYGTTLEKYWTRRLARVGDAPGTGLVGANTENPH
jgi:hypothetical protein